MSLEVAAAQASQKSIGSITGLEHLTSGQRYTAAIAAAFVLAILTVGAPNGGAGSSAEAIAGGVPAAAAGAGLVAQPQAPSASGTVAPVDAPVQPYLPEQTTFEPTTTLESPPADAAPTDEPPAPSTPPSAPPAEPPAEPSPLQPVLDLLP